jgi:hypothetical protein
MKHSLFVIAALGIALGTSVSFAATADCAGKGTEMETCLVVPEDYGTNVKAAKAAPEKTITMLSRAEISGEGVSLEQDFEIDVADELLADTEEVEDFADRGGVVALQEAIDVQKRIRDLETFLKGGPAANGPLTVITAGQ